jgi:hypothetical protein
MSDGDREAIGRLIDSLDRLEPIESNWERAELCADRSNSGPREAMRDYWTPEQRKATFAQLEAEREPWRRAADESKKAVLVLREFINEELNRAITIAAKSKESSNDLRVLQRNLQHLYPDPVFSDGKLVSNGCFVDADLRDRAMSFLKDLLIRLPAGDAKPGVAGKRVIPTSMEGPANFEGGCKMSASEHERFRSVTKLFEQWATMRTNFEASEAVGTIDSFPIASTVKMNDLLLKFCEAAKPYIVVAAHFGIEAEPLRMICCETHRYSDRPAIRKVLSELENKLRFGDTVSKPARTRDDDISPSARAFQRQQIRKMVNDLAVQARIDHEKDLVEMRKQPGFAPMLADPKWQPLDTEWRSTVEKYQQRREKWRDKFYEDLSPEEQEEERQLTNEQEHEMSELRRRLYRLQQAYSVHGPDPLRTPDQLVKSIRSWQLWAETLNQPGDNQNCYATERAAEARKAALRLREQYHSLASVPLPLSDTMNDLGSLLDWAITANRDVNEYKRKEGMFPGGPDGQAVKDFLHAVDANRPATVADVAKIVAEQVGAKNAHAKPDIAYWLPHAAAFAMLRIEDRTSKEQSKIMASIRMKAGESLKCRKAGNQFEYEPASWTAVVKLIGKEGGVERYAGPSRENIEAEKAKIRGEKGH